MLLLQSVFFRTKEDRKHRQKEDKKSRKKKENAASASELHFWIMDWSFFNYNEGHALLLANLKKAHTSFGHAWPSARLKDWVGASLP